MSILMDLWELKMESAVLREWKSGKEGGTKTKLRTWGATMKGEAGWMESHYPHSVLGEKWPHYPDTNFSVWTQMPSRNIYMGPKSHPLATENNVIYISFPDLIFLKSSLPNQKSYLKKGNVWGLSVTHRIFSSSFPLKWESSDGSLNLA